MEKAESMAEGLGKGRQKPGLGRSCLRRPISCTFADRVSNPEGVSGQMSLALYHYL